MAEPNTLRFHYIKGTDFRTFHADGVFGGPAPSGKQLNLSFYAERLPIPTETVHRLVQDPGGQVRLGEEMSDLRQSREGLIRELQCNIVMPLSAAKLLRDWLQTNIKLLEDAPTESASSEPKVET